MATNQRLSTRQLLVKIPNYPCLYKHSQNETYYAITKVGGNRKERSLQTTDRKIAERRLKQLLEDFGKIDSAVERMTLTTLLEKFEAMNRGKGDKTRATNASIIKIFKETWKRGLSIQVREVKPSDLSEWLASHEGRIKNATYNRYACFLKQLFAVAVADRVIARSPHDEIQTRWKKPQKPRRYVPTIEQFEKIVNNIRSQVYSADAEDTADFVEFLGCAGLGQAEARNLTWGAIDWQMKRLIVRRQKTGALFYPPIYPFLRPLLERLKAKRGAEAKPNERVFKINDAKRALKAACERLGYPAFSQRNIRAACIRRLWQEKIDVKLIAKWQGHSDGGKLILDTYTEVFGEMDGEYERLQLEKLSNMSHHQNHQSASQVSASCEAPLMASAIPGQ
jgi:integrase